MQFQDSRRPTTPVDCIPFLPGILFLGVAAGQVIVEPQIQAFEALLSWLSPVLLLGAGIVIHYSAVPPAQYSRLLGWALLGFISIGGIVLALKMSSEVQIDTLGSIFAGLGVGTLGGMLAGFKEGQARVRGREAERERLAAEHTRKENARLEHLNHLLRHDIRNSVMVIEGHADLLADDLPEETKKPAETIQRQAESIENLIQNVRSYMQATDETRPLQTQTLSETLRNEVSAIQDGFPGVEVSADIPAGVTVRADDLLGSVFSNLLRNAVVHNESASPEVTVTVEESKDVAVVGIRDNGPGIPDDLSAELGTPPEEGHHGFGLYLAHTLVSRYDGSLSFETPDGGGTLVTVTIPRTTGIEE